MWGSAGTVGATATMAPMSDPNATPPVPPAPPGPPAPPVPPVPQYGEYAPGGYVAPQPVAGPPQPLPYGAASYPQQAPARQRKTWDLVLTVVLLVLGFFGMIIGVLYAAFLGEILQEAYRQEGLGTFSGDTGAAGSIIVVSHVVLYLIAVGGSIPLLLSKRVAFWLPLAAGVIAAIIFWGALFVVMLNDPTLMNSLT